MLAVDAVAEPDRLPGEPVADVVEEPDVVEELDVLLIAVPGCVRVSVLSLETGLAPDTGLTVAGLSSANLSAEDLSAVSLPSALPLPDLPDPRRAERRLPASSLSKLPTAPSPLVEAGVAGFGEALEGTSLVSDVCFMSDVCDASLGD
nr:hypothetical protein [uncultured Halomonas sp.]